MTNLPSSDHAPLSKDDSSEEQGGPSPTATSHELHSALPLIDVVAFDVGDDVSDFFSELAVDADEILNFNLEKKVPPSKPRIEFIDQQQWLSFVERLDSNLRDQRLSDIAERIDSAGGCSR